MLVLSGASLIPFLSAVISVIKIIPCPRVAALVSNMALVGAFVAIFIVVYLVQANIFVTYALLMSIWPWMAIAVMIARLHIGRDRDLSNFSPIIHLPLLAILGSASMVGMLVALKSMTVTDCIILCFLDPLWSAIVHGILIARISYFKQHSRKFLLLIIGLFLYLYGQSYSGGVVRAYYDSTQFMTTANTVPVSSYFLFLGSRAAYLIKCGYLKFAFIPAEVDRVQEFKSLFPNFPFPIRFRLDVVFDSGLAEEFPHAIGPTGTKDIFTLTDSLYRLPIASVACWVIEEYSNNTLRAGLSSDMIANGAPPIGVAYLLVVLFVLSMALTPSAVSKILFDRGSSPHEWAGIPVVIALIFIGFDIVYVNPFISRFQIVCVGFLSLVLSNIRSDLWLDFKRRYYSTSLKELEFLQPSCVRNAQKQILTDALDKTGTDDFGTLLLETAIHHGNNMKEYLKAEKGGVKTVWDPNPAARAAWKLAGSLVLRAIRSRKSQLGIVKKKTDDDRRYMATVVQTFVKKVGSRLISN